MAIEFGTVNAEKREKRFFEVRDFSGKDKSCTIAGMRAAWGVKEKVIGMVDLVNGKKGRRG
jgi:hypothetical protein